MSCRSICAKCRYCNHDYERGWNCYFNTIGTQDCVTGRMTYGCVPCKEKNQDGNCTVFHPRPEEPKRGFWDDDDGSYDWNALEQKWVWRYYCLYSC